MARRTKNVGHLRVPTPTDIQACAARDHIDLTEEEAGALAPFVAAFLELLDEVEELPELLPELKHLHRNPGHVPTCLEEDPCNAFTRICRVEGAARGPLKGKTVAVKDNLAVAGIPITNGSRAASYTPVVDAVAVERILDAGATIIGKLTLDDFSFGSPVGYGASSIFGPPLNPRRPTQSAGDRREVLQLRSSPAL